MTQNWFKSCDHRYSGVPNKRAGWNKQAGGTFFGNSINEQSGISEKGRFFSKILINEQVGINKQARISKQGGI